MVTQAYFENIQSEIQSELLKSKLSIFVAVAWFTDSELFDILIRKASEGIKTSVLLLNDEINVNGFSLNFNLLKEKGGEVNLIGGKDEMMHNKFCVIDNSTVITGSYNWTRKAKLNDENITITKDSSELAFDFITEFQRLKKKYGIETGSSFIDTGTLLKRLELIKTCISLEDEEDINYQAGKLRKLIKEYQHEQADKIRDVLKLIEIKSYGDVAGLISDILENYSKIILWIDPEIQGFQLEIRALSLQLSSLEDELSDIEKTIHEFEIRHSQELGDIILEILSIKKCLSKQKLKEDPDSEKVKEDFEEADNDEKTFRENVEEIQKNKPFEITEEEQKELKSKFRKISKITHPDIVDKKYVAEAAKLFMRAKEAKDKNDLITLNEILEYLKNGAAFKQKHETLREVEQLRFEANNLRFKIKQLLQKILDVKQTEAYKTIESIKDWNAYFKSSKIYLQEELEKLQKMDYEYQ